MLQADSGETYKNIDDMLFNTSYTFKVSVQADIVKNDTKISFIYCICKGASVLNKVIVAGLLNISMTVY